MAIKKPFTAPIGVDLDNTKIINVAAPTDSGDGVNKAFSVNASNITTGTLSVANGGTGLSSFTADRVFYSSSTSSISQSSNLTFDGTTLTAANLATGGSVTLSGGTANSIPYLNGSKVLTSGSALFFDGTRMQIGANMAGYGSLNVYRDTNAPYATITMGDQATPTNSVGLYLRQNTGVAGVSTAGADLAFYLGGPAVSEQMRLTTTGLGIGTSSPSTKLQVVGGAKVGTGAATNNATLLVNQPNGSAAGLQLFQDGQESWIMEVPTSNTSLRWTASGTEYMRLNNGGNLGIGTTSPVGKLVVSNAGAGGIEFFPTGGPGSGAYINIYNRSTSQYIQGTTYASAHTWYVGADGATRAMDLDTSGNLGLGVIPSNASSIARSIEFGQRGVLWATTNSTNVALGANAYLNASSAWTYKQTGVASAYQQDGTHRWFIAVSGTGGDPISFTQAMMLDASGNLGVGVTPSAWSSTQKVITFGGASLAATGNTGGPKLFNNAYINSAGDNIYQNSNYATYYFQAVADGSHRWYIAPSGTAGNVITFTQAMTLDANNNLLVGTTITGADGLGVSRVLNLTFPEGSGASYANIFRQTSSAATVISNGYKRSATSNGFASSVGTSWAKTAIGLGVDAGSISFYADPAATTSNGTDVTPTERVRIKSTGQTRFIPLSSDPSGAESGDVYYNSTTNKLRCYNGSTWNDLF